MGKFLHIADVHVGREFGTFGPFGKRLREQILTSFTQTLRLAQDRGADAVVIAGDLFEKQSPDRKDQEAAWGAIAAVQLPVIALPGTHDPLTHLSGYNRGPRRPANLHVLNEKPVTVPTGALAFHGRAAAQFDQQCLVNVRPITGVSNVAVAHASIPRGDIPHDGEEIRITREEIELSGVCYCALGHWHSCQQVWPESPIQIWYAGSPEPLQFDGQSGYALEVECAASNVRVTRHRVGRYLWAQHEIDVRTFESPNDVHQAIVALANPDAVVEIRFRGPIPAAAAFDAERLERELEDRFAYLRLNTTGLRTEATHLDPNRLFHPGTTGHAFVVLAREKQAVANDAESALWDAVLRRGTALLAGEEEV